MSQIKSSSVRTLIMDAIKTKFGGFAFWTTIERDIAMLCASLPDPSTEEKQHEFIEGLIKIKLYFLDKQIIPSELTFLDEEIERYENTKQISLYVEDEDKVEDSVIDRYAKLGVDTEGVVGIHLPFNYTQLVKLTNGVFKQTGFIKFYISREKTLYGKIIAEIYEHAQKIPIATLIESKRRDKETEEPTDRRIALFGERINGKEYNKKKEIQAPFYVYRFITDSSEELILFTTTQYDIGDYIITGVITQCDDYRMLTDSAKLPTKLPFFFAQTVRNRIVKYKNHAEFLARLEFLNISKEDFFEYPFTIHVPKKRGTFILKHPVWFKRLIWSWLTHTPIGLFNNYPLHLIILGPKASGKSMLINSLFAKSKEARPVFSGAQSTLKNLVPSFKYNPAKLGYLAESNRFSFCDELLRCLMSVKTGMGGSREESVAMMNDLLEHQKREAGSGVSRVNVNMTSRVLSTTNPVRDIHNVEDLINSMDESWLSRQLVYQQTEEHINLIRRSKDPDLLRYNGKLEINDWISLLDYLHSFNSEYDMDKVEEIYKSMTKVMSETLKRHYDARHMHHIECLMDGIVKTRCLLERDMSFQANEEDYKILNEVWTNIIKSWLNPATIKNMPVEARINYLPENSQFIYWKINAEFRPMSVEEVKNIALKAMSKTEFAEALQILIDNGVLIEEDNYVRPYYLKDDYSGAQQKLGVSSRRDDDEVVQGSKASV